MIRITCELISARTGQKKILGIAEICNDGSGTNEIGNYNIKLSKWFPKQNEIWKSGRVENFERLRRGVWDLLYLGLKNILQNRNKEVTK